MKTFNIHTTPDSYKKWGGGIGDIYVQLDDYPFPGSGWTDFGFNIIYWWMNAFAELLDGDLQKVKCKFMDGNYRFDVSKVNLDIWNIEFIAERKNDEIWQSGEVYVDQAISSVIQVAKVLQEIDRHEEKYISVENYERCIQKLNTFLLISDGT